MASGLETPTRELALKLKEETGMSKKEIREAVKETKEKYSPLLTSNKTALMLYARKYKNIQLVEKTPPDIEIKNIVPEIKDLTFECKVRSIDKFTYTKEGEKRKGCEVMLYDDTGSIKMMLWGEDVDKVSKSLEDEVVRIENAYSNKYKGEVQVNYGKETKIKKVN